MTRVNIDDAQSANAPINLKKGYDVSSATNNGCMASHDFTHTHTLSHLISNYYKFCCTSAIVVVTTINLILRLFNKLHQSTLHISLNVYQAPKAQIEC